jgi:hypothetical protein
VYWVEEDNLLFNVMSEDKKSLLYSFLIIPSTSEIKLLEGAERHALLGEIDKNASLVSTETWAGKTAKTIVSALSGLTGGRGITFGKPYTGKIENNGTVLNFDISIKRAGGGSAFSSAYYVCDYVAKNSRTGTTLTGNRRFADIDEDRVEPEVKDWLKSWRVSPDGRYYVIGGSATFVDPEEEENSTYTNLIENYDRVYAGFDISPRWDKIALLNIKDDEKTKQMNYWIEFYPFDYRKSDKKASTEAMTKEHQRDSAGCCMFCLPSLPR